MEDKEEVVLETNFPDIPLHSRGKVRDIYDLEDRLLIVATDRISAFDVVLPNGIPRKGMILTALSKFWFSRMEDIIPHHLISTEVCDFPPVAQKYWEILKGRAMLVKKARPLPVECVVRGYLSGSGWKEYLEIGSISGIGLPKGLKEASRLPSPLFTPATKAPQGEHDQNMSFGMLVQLIGEEGAQKIRSASLKIYERARSIAEKRGIIIADTKFEFGIREGKLILIDELLTPDSSRFWPQDDYHPGGPQRSFDKQFVRDYLLTLDWDRHPPAPSLPEDIISLTSQKYQEALQWLVDEAI